MTSMQEVILNPSCCRTQRYACVLVNNGVCRLESNLLIIF